MTRSDMVDVLKAVYPTSIDGRSEAVTLLDSGIPDFAVPVDGSKFKFDVGGGPYGASILTMSWVSLIPNCDPVASVDLIFESGNITSVRYSRNLPGVAPTVEMIGPYTEVATTVITDAVAKIFKAFIADLNN